MEPRPQNLRVPKPKKKKARGVSETRRGLKGSLLLEEISVDYRVIYKSCKRFLVMILFFGADNPTSSVLVVLRD